MYLFILILHVIASFVLVAVILLQAGRGGGLAETFGGGGGQTTIFGQKASTFLTKATTVSAVLFLCTSLGLALISSRRQRSLMENIKPAPARNSGIKVTSPAKTQAPVPATPPQQPQSPSEIIQQVAGEKAPAAEDDKAKPAPSN